MIHKLLMRGTIKYESLPAACPVPGGQAICGQGINIWNRLAWLIFTLTMLKDQPWEVDFMNPLPGLIWVGWDYSFYNNVTSTRSLNQALEQIGAISFHNQVLRATTKINHDNLIIQTSWTFNYCKKTIPTRNIDPRRGSTIKYNNATFTRTLTNTLN